MRGWCHSSPLLHSGGSTSYAYMQARARCEYLDGAMDDIKAWFPTSRKSIRRGVFLPHWVHLNAPRIFFSVVDVPGYVYDTNKYTSELLPSSSTSSIFKAYWQVITTRECGVAMRSMASVCLSVCLSCSCSNFWKPWPRNYAFGMEVDLQNILVNFVYRQTGSRSRSQMRKVKRA